MVLVDGRPIREFSLAGAARQYWIVPQETFLFSDRIRENIALGVESASDQEIHDAADAANIAADIEGFPDRYQTMVGERGITLSGGQKQRAAIARALIRNPRILILDDALSSVRHSHRRQDSQSLARGDAGTHHNFHLPSRFHSAQCDRIAVLHDGHIVELGTQRRTARLERLLQRPV